MQLTIKSRLAKGGKLETLTLHVATFMACHTQNGFEDTYVSPEVPFELIMRSVHANGIDSAKTLSHFTTSP